MTLAESAADGLSSLLPRADQFSRSAGIGREGAGIPDQLAFWIQMNGIDLSREEEEELKILGEFLDRHVVSHRIGDVQRMLLWNEWVRTYRRRTRGFPGLIREQEFSKAVTGLFGAGIATDGWRGPVFTGIRYVS